MNEANFLTQLKSSIRKTPYELETKTYEQRICTLSLPLGLTCHIMKNGIGVLSFQIPLYK